MLFVCTNCGKEHEKVGMCMRCGGTSVETVTKESACPVARENAFRALQLAAEDFRRAKDVFVRQGGEIISGMPGIS